MQNINNIYINAFVKKTWAACIKVTFGIKYRWENSLKFILMNELIHFVQSFQSHDGTSCGSTGKIDIPLIHVLLDDVIKWKDFRRYWPFVRGIHRSPHRGQWRGAMFSLICTWINGWVNNREAGDLRRYRAHYDVIVMISNLANCVCSLLISQLFNHHDSLH